MAAERVERMAHHEQLGGGVDVGALHAPGVPRPADLHALHGGQDVVVAGGAQHFAAGLFDDREGEAVALGTAFQRGLDVGAGVGRLGHGGDAQRPQLAVGRRGGEARFVGERERLQADAAVLQDDGFDEGHGDRCVRERVSGGAGWTAGGPPAPRAVQAQSAARTHERDAQQAGGAVALREDVEAEQPAQAVAGERAAHEACRVGETFDQELPWGVAGHAQCLRGSGPVSGCAGS